MSKPAMTPQQSQLVDGNESALRLYKSLSVGDNSSYAFLAYYELCQLLFGNLPGLLGLGLRGAVYPTLFAKCGKRPGLGRGMVLRGSRQIELGEKALIDDYAVLDVRGSDGKMVIEDFVSIGRYSTLAAKNGEIRLAQGVNVGSYCRIATQTKVEIAESALIAAYCYIGPGNHKKATSGQPLISQQMELKGGVKIGAHAWIGTRATILDGVSIGDRAIVGAHSLVVNDVAPNTVVVGTPARVVSPHNS
jgi:acetyltransferase-like isoleucine patch superfamily enzyme